jgi:hypothetical protein
MAEIDPKNLTALLHFRGTGNPPTTTPATAISNCFPGLEFDFRNIWRRLFVGIVLHEADNLVVSVDAGAPAEVKAVVDKRLVSVNGVPVTAPVTGPRQVGGAVATLAPAANLEWGNALADVVTRPGSRAQCVFQDQDPATGAFVGAPISVQLEVRALLDGAAIALDVSQPGELTQSLCSPWQNDYRECGCYYWAASRPDFVNVDTSTAKAQGHNWLQKKRGPATPKDYFASDLVTYEELFKDWPKHLRFVENGNDKANE